MADTDAGTGRRLFKVSVDLPAVSDNWPPFTSESIFVQKTAVKSEGQVKSIPYFAKGIAVDDIIRVLIDHEAEELAFAGLVRESGHSTVRILLEDEQAAPQVAQLLDTLGCEWEKTTIDIHWAVDVPRETSYRMVRDALDRLESAGQIQYEEGAISSVHRQQIN